MAVQDTTKTVDSYNYDTFARSETANKSNEFKGRLRAGDEAPDFELPTLDGQRVRLSGLRGKKHVLLEFGSIT
jgi:peroxiredoxin